MISFCPFKPNSKIGKSKKLLTREMGNPTGAEIGVPAS
jgi:hypothetical protein